MARDSRTTVHDKGSKKIKSQNLRWHARQRMLTRTHERNILLRIRTHTQTDEQVENTLPPPIRPFFFTLHSVLHVRLSYVY